jgi:hypothetical protein
MMNGNESKVWVNPDGHALAFLKKCAAKREGKPKGRKLRTEEVPLQENQTPMNEVRQKAGKKARRQRRKQNTHPTWDTAQQEGALVRASVVVPEIVAPDLAPMPEPSRRELARLKDLHHESMDALDLSKPEGSLDAWFGRPNHRIRKKIERAELLEPYKQKVINHLRQMRQAMEEVQKMNEIERREYLDKVKAAREAAEEKLRLALVAREARRREAIEEARAQATIANYESQARNSQRDLLPPPPQPDPLEQSWREKRQEKELRLQEHEIEAEYGGDKVTRANDEAMKVFRNRYMTEGEQRMRIIEILNAYDLDADVLPEGIQKLLEEEEFHDE